MKRSKLAVRAVQLASACIATEGAVARAADAIPSPPREFRAAWIASVANIDWPSKKGLSPATQRSLRSDDSAVREVSGIACAKATLLCAANAFPA